MRLKNPKGVWRDTLNGEFVSAKILAEGLFPLPICVIIKWVILWKS